MIFGKSWFLPLLITIILLIGGGLYIYNLTQAEGEISQEGMSSRIEQMYGGRVTNILQENGQYKALLERSDGNYEVLADQSKGDIVSITLLNQVPNSGAPLKTQDEIIATVTKEYEGTVERIELNSHAEPPVYSVEIAKDETLITLSVDANTGIVLDTTEKQTTAEQALLTKEQAITKAKTKLSGKVEYIVYEETPDGGYYLIEIESEDDQEAVIQVHGVSGKILSITWDDQDDSDDD
jgi:uncharacterized membrane protein YkoI